MPNKDRSAEYAKIREENAKRKAEILSQKKCLDCEKQLTDVRAKRCKVCSKKFAYAEVARKFREGRYRHIERRKQIYRRKVRPGEESHKCLDCPTLLYFPLAVRCKECRCRYERRYSLTWQRERADERRKEAGVRGWIRRAARGSSKRTERVDWDKRREEQAAMTQTPCERMAREDGFAKIAEVVRREVDGAWWGDMGREDAEQEALLAAWLATQDNDANSSREQEGASLELSRQGERVVAEAAREAIKRARGEFAPGGITEANGRAKEIRSMVRSEKSGEYECLLDLIALTYRPELVGVEKLNF